MTDRERAWRYIKEHRRFTYSDLMAETSISRDNAGHMCQMLEERGLLEREEENCAGGRRLVYELLRIPASDRPWDEDPDVTSWRQQVWNAMRMRTRFGIRDLMKSLSEDVDVSRTAVDHYVKALEHADVVRRQGRTTTAAGGRAVVYELSVRPGPTPPDVKRYHELRKSGAIS